MKSLITAAMFCMAASPLIAQNAGIGTSSPNASAALDIQSSNRGLLIPRVKLQGIGTYSPVTGTAAVSNNGLLVYNTVSTGAGSNAVFPGFYYWNYQAAAWKRLQDAPTTAGGTTGWGINGNTGITVPLQFLGTTDAQPLVFRVNGMYAGLVHYNGSTSMGFQSGTASVIPGNTAFGGYALENNTTGEANTAFGGGALASNISGSKNTAAGSQALTFNTTGSENTAIGNRVLTSNDNGYQNVAVGSAVFTAGISGVNNTGIGTGIAPLAKTVYGTNAMGWNALANLNPANNAAAFYNASFNTAVGAQAMLSTISGGFNTAVGLTALYRNVAGSYNTIIGDGADVISAQTINNSTAIGEGAYADTSYMVRLGSSTVTVIQGFVPYSIPSDGRFKSNINYTGIPGLALVNRIRPVSYYFNTAAYDEHMLSATNVKLSRPAPDAAQRKYTSRRRTGFLAQQVAAACDAVGYDFDGIHRANNTASNSHYLVAYSQFVLPEIVALQQQEKQIRELETSNQQLLEKTNMLMKEYELLRAKLQSSR